ncbi:MAG TPA: isoprenylcysteine carboxylmethyltransferase family protein [Candidatus Binataceae bacterium]|nr:isoprenylcysteine carboxylmethyltransferase family protein [Candidatus Binataceae bacterium]
MSQLEAIALHIPAPLTIRPPVISSAGLKHALGNVLLASSFFVAALPSANQAPIDLANAVWIIGAVIMGVFSLVRLPPKTAMVTVPAIAASAGMLVIPCLMRPVSPSTGWLMVVGIVLEMVGVALSQIARIYMGRSFGILPANRGLVSKGPFSSVRHPIYLGWLILTIGFAFSYPTARNVLLIVASIPFLVWRIQMEEGLLALEPAYRVYQQKVRFRLWPGVI